MNIRYATMADLDDIASVESECFPVLEAATKEEFEQRIKYYGNHFWLMFDEGKLIAFVDGFVTDEADLTDDMYENASMHNENGAWQMIFGVNTLPEYRRCGCAKELIKKAILDARKQNRKGLVLTCKESLVPYYSKFGFIDEGITDKSTHGNVLWHQMRLDFKLRNNGVNPSDNKKVTANKKFAADRILSYFKEEWKVLLIITVSGFIYNLGLLFGPWFEGKMAGCLIDILAKNAVYKDMLILVIAYVISIGVVQVSRYIKRFYVRRFANNVNRRMKKILYGTLVLKSRTELEGEGMGDIMTKAILDVDDCAEGMRKFTTEIFDTGVAMAAYAGMLLVYDVRLALIAMIFPPISYIIAEKMKVIVQKTGSAYKKQSGILSNATLDRASNAITYRVYGREVNRKNAYEDNLAEYEKSAIYANIWNSSLTPLYRIISMMGILFILYFGSRNVLGTGWRTWDIAAFTTFLACFIKLSDKSSKAAKLFNAVHKAQVSWKRIKPLMVIQAKDTDCKNQTSGRLEVQNLSFTYPDGKNVYNGISFTAEPGQIIGVTGPVASGKSTFGRTFLCEYPYEGSIMYNGCELRNAADNVRSGIISYLGHDPELFNDSVRNNVLLGDDYDVFEYLRAVCMDKEVEAMEQGADTIIGSEGIRLSGGQAQRIALARTLCHKKLVLVLDDPFSALDRNTEEQIYKKLKDMASDNIVILISHRLYMFPKMDKVIWLDAGKANVGTHKELMLECPGYRKMYETVSVEECRTVETENEGLAAAKVVENSRRVVDKHE
ncbi:aBC-type multidrug transport system ATPase and permease components [Eubacterium sp. CAG:248]|nr:aBC-type multidrug transport system ATPase and permease components [Eubacterium sp. CAG:248]